MGINYVDTIVLYNRYDNYTSDEELYYGTRFENVRIELTQGANIQTSGLENADVCVVKIPNKDLPKEYKAPRVWANMVSDDQELHFTINKDAGDFFIITKKEELGIEIDPPTGRITRRDYPEGLFEELSVRYGYTYKVNTVDVYNLIPRFQIGGR